MANNPIAGPKSPEEHSGIRNIGMLRWSPVAIIVGGLIWTIINPIHTDTHDPSVATAGTEPLSADQLVQSAIVVTPRPSPHVVASPMPVPSPVQSATYADISSQIAASPQGVPPNAAGQSQATSTAPPTISPAALARQQRADADRAALDSPVQIVAVKSDPAPTSAPPVRHEQQLWLRAGTPIGPLTLYTSGTSTMPELLVAYLAEPLFDSTHRFMVAPRGAKLICKYGSGGSFSVTQNSTHLPANCYQLQVEDKVIALGDQPAIDPTGTSGIGASVNRHTAAAIKNLVLLSAVGALLNRGGGCGSNCGVSYGSNSSSVGGAVVSAGEKMLPQNGQQEPTLGVSEGAQFMVMVTNDVAVKEWAP